MATPHPALNFWIIALGYKDLFDQSMTEADLIALLKTFNRNELLVLLSKIGLVLHNDKAEQWYAPRVQMFLISAFLDQPTQRALHKKLKELTKENREDKHFALFAELQIINLMKLAILHCSDNDGAGISTEGERFRFGQCCLVMNDLLRPSLPLITEDKKEEVTTRSETGFASAGTPPRHVPSSN